MGFQDMPEIVHKMASAKGGRQKGKKGLAAMSDEQRKAIQSLGGKARNEQVQKQIRDSDGREPDTEKDKV